MKEESVLNNQKFVRIGDKLVQISRVENGIPVIEATSEEITHPDGRKDVVVHVPYLQINSKKE